MKALPLCTQRRSPLDVCQSFEIKLQTKLTTFDFVTTANVLDNRSVFALFALGQIGDARVDLDRGGAYALGEVLFADVAHTLDATFLAFVVGVPLGSILREEDASRHKARSSCHKRQETPFPRVLKPVHF